MMKDVWIGVIGVLGGAVIGILGQIIGNQINHKNQIKRIKKEAFIQKKFNYYEQISEALENDFIIYTERVLNRKRLEKYEENKKKITSAKINFFQNHELDKIYLEYLNAKKELRGNLTNDGCPLKKDLSKMSEYVIKIQNKLIDILSE